jgi:hypothetical protein
VEHFEGDDDNDNHSDDVEDVSVHGSWITRRCPGRQAILMIATSQHASFVSAITVRYIVESEKLLSASLHHRLRSSSNLSSMVSLFHLCCGSCYLVVVV